MTGLYLLLALFLLLLNAFFVLAEFAIVKVRSSKVEELFRRALYAQKFSSTSSNTSMNIFLFVSWVLPSQVSASASLESQHLQG